MIKPTAMLCLAMCLSATAVQAEPASSGPLLKKDKLSIGAGIVRNTIDVNMPGFDNSEIGYQFFAAYDLDKVHLIEGAHSSLELGYMDYGFNNRNSGGLWTTYVLDGAIRENFGWVARIETPDRSHFEPVAHHFASLCLTPTSVASDLTPSIFPNPCSAASPSLDFRGVPPFRRRPCPKRSPATMWQARRKPVPARPRPSWLR